MARHRDVDDVPEVALPLTHVESHTYVLAHYAWQAGGRDPRLASIYATQLAAPGGDSHLERGIAVCDEALLFRDGSTDDAWRELLARRAQLAGRLSRLKVRFTHHLDADGNPIPVRRHHPAQPRRIRPGRFCLR